jgi:hypothetical protein
MKFTEQLNQADDAQPPISKPVPMIAKNRLPDDSDHLADLQDRRAEAPGQQTVRAIARSPEGDPCHPAGPTLYPFRSRRRHAGGEEGRNP